MENINNLTKEIGQTAFDNVPVDNWNSIIIKVAMLTTYVELVAICYAENGEEKYYDPDYPGSPHNKMVDSLFIDLRKAMYALTPGKGAWYNAEMTITPDGSFSLTYDYDHKPDFEMIPEDVEYVTDTKEFPRDDASTPLWLNELITA